MSIGVYSALDRLSGWLLPPRCVLCGDCGQSPCLDLCRGCEACLPGAREPVREMSGPLRRTIAPFAYAAPLDHLVQAFKYRGHLATGRVLATLLADRLDALGWQDDVDVIVPVPLHPTRLAERGFNQTAEIARELGRRLRLPVDLRMVERRDATVPQVGLHHAERARNVATAFVARRAAGRRPAIVDDVTTTGSTLRSVADALLGAGAVAVDGWCVAVAHRPAPPAERALAGAERS